MKNFSNSANLHAVGDLRYESLPIDTVGDDEVLVKVKRCGVCGSDIDRVFKKGTYHFPTVIGHEFSGKVIYDTENALTDKKVVIFPLMPCFECESCKSGSYATCENYDYYGSRRNGGMTEYIPIKRWNLLIMPENLSYDEGAMCEPVSVARHATLKLDIKKGDSVLITGAGPIGIIAGQWAKSFGADKIYYIDIDKRKIELAKAFGFCEYKDEISVDCVIEGTGFSEPLTSLLKALKPHGKAVLMGNPAGEVSLSQNAYWYILRKELKISGTWNSAYNDIQNDWKESLSAMSEKKINVLPLITHRYPLCECNSAFDMMNSKKEFYTKVMLTMNEED